jgi:nucleoside-diphosphate-sugar epimerase
MPQKRALVAGGGGFIGSNLCAALLREGWEVDCVDNFITGRKSAIEPLLQEPGFRLIECDITSPRLFRRVPDVSYDWVFHLACPTGVPNIRKLGEEMMLASSTGTHNLLNVSRDANAKFLYVSSAEAYGDAQVVPQPETYAGNVDPIGPRSPYEEGKRFGEALTAYYSSMYGIDSRIVRVFNTYGPGMSSQDTRVVPQFLRRTIEGKPVTVYGDGSQTRSFLYIDDLLSGIFALMRDGLSGDVYNIGAEHETSISDLVAAIGEVTGRKVWVRHAPHFIQDHARRAPSTRKVQELGWRPATPLLEGLRRSLPDMKAQLVSAQRRSRRESARPEPIGMPLPSAVG